MQNRYYYRTSDWERRIAQSTVILARKNITLSGATKKRAAPQNIFSDRQSIARCGGNY
jgi:hypothetical protein